MIILITILIPFPVCIHLKFNKTPVLLFLSCTTGLTTVSLTSDLNPMICFFSTITIDSTKLSLTYYLNQVNDSRSNNLWVMSILNSRINLNISFFTESKLRTERTMSRCLTWFTIIGLGEPPIKHQSVWITSMWDFTWRKSDLRIISGAIWGSI